MEQLEQHSAFDPQVKLTFLEQMKIPIKMQAPPPKKNQDDEMSGFALFEQAATEEKKPKPKKGRNYY